MAFDPKELQQLSEIFAKAIKNTASPFSNTKTRSPSNTNAGDSMASLSKSLIELAKTAKEEVVVGKKQLVTNKKYNELIDDINSALIKSSGMYKVLVDELDDLTHKSLPDQQKYLQNYSKVTKDLSTEMGKSLRNTSLFSASLLESHSKIKEGSQEYYEMMEEMHDAAQPLNKGLLKAAGALEDGSDVIRKNLNPTDFAKIRVKMGQVQTALAEGLVGFGSMAEIMSKGEAAYRSSFSNNTAANAKLRQSIIATAIALKQQGIDVGNNKLLNENGQINQETVAHLSSRNGSSDMINMMRSLSSIESSTNKSSTSLGNVGAKANSTMGGFLYQMQSAGKGMGIFGGALSFFGEKLKGDLSKNLSTLKDSLKGIYNQVVDFNVANIPDTFAHVQMASMKMGMSFEDTVKFMQANKGLMAVYGGGFGGLQGSLQNTFQKFGFNQQQAAGLYAPGTAAAMGAGINVRNGQALNTFIDTSMKSFQSLAGVLDITAEQYLSLTADLLSSHDVQAQLVGLNKTQAVQQATAITQERDYLAVQLGSTEQANNLLKAQQAAQRAPVMTRIKEGAMGMLALQQAGFSGQAASDYYQIKQKGPRATAEEKNRLTSYQMRLGVSREKAIQNGNLSTDVMFERLGLGSGEEIAQAGLQQQQRANAGLIPTAAEQDAAARAAAGNSTVAGVSQTINQVSSVLGNNFVTALWSSVAALGGLTASALSSAGTMAMSGGSGVGGLLGKFGMGGGAAGGLLGKSGKLLGKAAIPLAILGGLYEGYTGWNDASKAESSGQISHQQADEQKGSSIGGAAGGVLGGIATGALAGSLFGPIGTILGGIAGGVIGAWGGSKVGGAIGSSIGASPSNANPASVAALQAQESINNTTGSDMANVEDKTAHSYLASISDNMALTATLLKQIADSGDATATTLATNALKKTNIPTANAYLTGRAS
jgi:hypothetical protein